MSNFMPLIKENRLNKNISNNLSENSNIVNENINNNDDGDNYKLPKNDDIFKFKNDETINMETTKGNRNLKIWEKKTFSTANPLKLFKNYGIQNEKSEKNESNSENLNEIDNKKIKKKKIFNEDTKRIIEEAKRIIDERKQERKNHTYLEKKKETIQKVVEQRKEIFLVTMTTQIVLEEQKKLKNNIDNKKRALSQYNKSLDNDKNTFKEYYDEKKKLTQKALEDARTITLEKTELVQKIKTINQKFGNLKSENLKMQDNESNLVGLRIFLDSLKSDNLKNDKELKYEELKNKLEFEYLENKKKECKTMNKSYNELNFKNEFSDMVSKGMVKELNQINKQETNIFFTDPKQLMEIFTKMEENNLYLIQSTQELDKTLQEEKLKLKRIKDEKNRKIEVLKSQEESLKFILDQNEKKYRKLIKKVEENKINQEFKNFDKIEDLIYQIINLIISDMDKNSFGTLNIKENKNKNNILRFLSEIEKYIYKLMRFFKPFDKKKLIEKRNNLGNKNKNINNNPETSKNEKMRIKKIIDKNFKINNKPKLPKRRKEMKKYPLKKNNKNEDIKEEKNDEEENKKYFEFN